MCEQRKADYRIITVESAEEIVKAEKAAVSIFKWTDNSYCPETTAALVYIKDKGFFARLECKELFPKALELEPDGSVYKDSCMEWFVNFTPENGPMYMNLEGNAAGTLHCKLGKDRHGRQPLPENVQRPLAKAGSFEEGWFIEYFVPMSTVSAIYGKDSFTPGTVIHGNFYKCGDETEIPHFGMWNEVALDNPDFHRPEFFGVMEIV